MARFSYIHGWVCVCVVSVYDNDISCVLPTWHRRMKIFDVRLQYIINNNHLFYRHIFMIRTRDDEKWALKISLFFSVPVLIQRRSFFSCERSKLCYKKPSSCAPNGLDSIQLYFFYDKKSIKWNGSDLFFVYTIFHLSLRWDWHE